MPVDDESQSAVQLSLATTVPNHPPRLHRLSSSSCSSVEQATRSLLPISHATPLAHTNIDRTANTMNFLPCALVESRFCVFDAFGDHVVT